MGIARNIVAYREENGSIHRQRSKLMKVPKLGDKTFNQCAGFIRVSGGDEPLDATSVHPESYKAAEAMLAKLGMDKEDLRKGGIPDIDDRIWAVYGEEEKPEGGKAGKTRAKSLADLKALSQKASEKREKAKEEYEKSRSKDGRRSGYRRTDSFRYNK